MQVLQGAILLLLNDKVHLLISNLSAATIDCLLSQADGKQLAVAVDKYDICT